MKMSQHEDEGSDGSSIVVIDSDCDEDVGFHKSKECLEAANSAYHSIIEDDGSHGVQLENGGFCKADAAIFYASGHGKDSRELEVQQPSDAEAEKDYERGEDGLPPQSTRSAEAGFMGGMASSLSRLQFSRRDLLLIALLVIIFTQAVALLFSLHKHYCLHSGAEEVDTLLQQQTNAIAQLEQKLQGLELKEEKFKAEKLGGEQQRLAVGRHEPETQVKEGGGNSSHITQLKQQEPIQKLNESKKFKAAEWLDSRTPMIYFIIGRGVTAIVLLVVQLAVLVSADRSMRQSGQKLTIRQEVAIFSFIGVTTELILSAITSNHWDIRAVIGIMAIYALIAWVKIHPEDYDSTWYNVVIQINMYIALVAIVLAPLAAFAINLIIRMLIAGAFILAFELVTEHVLYKEIDPCGNPQSR